MALFIPGPQKPQTIEYLFVDGAYLRNRLEEWSKDYFNGATIELNYEALRKEHEKCFYYDCLPPKHKNEEQTEYAQKCSRIRDSFNAMRELRGFHVFEGSTSGENSKQRQKQVDVMIAVHMFSHTVRGNMQRATLLTGDLDFKPLIDALIQEGMYISLWCEKKSASKELIYAADCKRDLNILEVWKMTTNKFKEAFPPPV